MKILRKRRKSDDEEASYWLSYSDMMAGLLLIFVLIISFTMLQAKSNYEQKETELAEKVSVILAQQTELSDKETQLANQQALLDNQQTELDEQKLLLDAQQLALDDAQTQLEDQQTALSDAQTKLDEQQSVLDALQAVLENQEQLLADKESLVTTQQEQLDEQQIQLDKIIGVKANLITALKDEFEKTNLSVSVDEKTGAITLDASILFETEEFELIEAGTNFLDSFVPVYLNVLLSPDYIDYVSEIIIEGHTDTEGTYLHNLELSQKRAMAVASYVLDEESGVIDPVVIDQVREIVTANGKSFSNPIYYDNGEVNMDASRRVEFKFRLNDEEMVQEMRDILDNEEDNLTTGDEPVEEY